MHAQVLDDDVNARLPLWLAVLGSVALHLALAGSASLVPPRTPVGLVWAEMTVVKPPPPPPPPPPLPEPEPEPEKPKPRAPVEAEPEPDPPVAEVDTVPVVVQGLSQTSFAEGSGTAFTVRAGTTTSVRAEGSGLKLGEAVDFKPVAFGAVSKPPKIKRQPVLNVPSELRELGIEGSVQVVLTVVSDGTVSEVKVQKSLHPAADAACIAALRDSRWDPGISGATVQSVSGVPFACTFRKVSL